MNSIQHFLIFVLVSSTIFVEISSHPHKQLKATAVEESCAKEHGVETTFSEYIFNGTQNIKDKIGKEKLPCAVGCFLQGYGMITGDGHFDARQFLRLLPHFSRDLKLDAEAINVIKSCDKTKGDCPCSTALMIAKCLPPVVQLHFHKKQWL